MRHFIESWVEHEATETGEQTTKGVLERDFPIRSGNSFTIYVNPYADSGIPFTTGKFLRVLNFNAENLKELLRLEIVAWPIKVRVNWQRE
jgi:hypothetical protein